MESKSTICLRLSAGMFSRLLAEAVRRTQAGGKVISVQQVVRDTLVEQFKEGK